MTARWPRPRAARPSAQGDHAAAAAQHAGALQPDERAGHVGAAAADLVGQRGVSDRGAAAAGWRRSAATTAAALLDATRSNVVHAELRQRIEAWGRGLVRATRPSARRGSSQAP